MPARDPPGMATVIEPVCADDRAAMDGWFDLMTLCQAHDTPELPPPCPLGHSTRFSWPGFEHRAWAVSRRAPIVVGAARRDAAAGTTTSDHGFADVLVGPRHRRRRGLGSRLLDHRHRPGPGRRPDPAGAAVPDCAPRRVESRARNSCARPGARLGQVELRRRLDLPPADAQRHCATSRGPPARPVGATGSCSGPGPTPANWCSTSSPRSSPGMSTDAPHGRPDDGAAALGRRPRAGARRGGRAERRCSRSSPPRRRRTGTSSRSPRPAAARARGRLRAPGRHARRRGPPRAPARPVDQAREPGAAAARAPGDPGDRHVQRRREPVDDRGQRR